MTRRQRNLLTLVERFDTQEAFAREVGIDPASLSRLLHGHQALGNARARKIEAALGLEVGWLDHDYSRASDRWHDYMKAALAAGQPSEVAAEIADHALKEHEQRWE